MDGTMEPLPETRAALAELVSFDEPDVDDLLHDLGERASASCRSWSASPWGWRRRGSPSRWSPPEQCGCRARRGAVPRWRPVRGGDRRTQRHLEQSTTDDPLDEERWSLYARVGAAVGVASSLSLPIYREGAGSAVSTSTPRPPTPSPATTASSRS